MWCGELSTCWNYRCNRTSLSVSLSADSNITEKRRNGFLWKFQDRSGMTPGTIWNILELIWINTWMQSFFYFFGWNWYLLAALRKNRFSLNFQDRNDLKYLGHILDHRFVIGTSRREFGREWHSSTNVIYLRIHFPFFESYLWTE